MILSCQEPMTFKMDIMKISLAILALISIELLCTVVSSNKVIRIGLYKGTTDEAGAFNQPLTSYYTQIGIGTPPKLFNMSIDINAVETWVPHYSFLGGIIFNRLHYKRGYSKKDSSSSVKEDIKYTFEHMQCSLQGKPYEDIFEFTNILESFNRVALRQKFISVSSASNDRLADLPIDGILAFNGAYSSIQGTRPILVNMYSSKLIEEAKFGLWLNSDPNSRDGGELTIGGINPSRFMGVMINHDVVTSQEKWGLELREVLIGDSVISCYRKQCFATLSSGTNDLFGPNADVARLIDSLRSIRGGIDIRRSPSNDNLYEIDCHQIDHLPPIKFVIGDIPYAVQAIDYVKRSQVNSVYCYIAIFPNQYSNKQWILGTNFLSNYYTVFDHGKNKVGIAAKSGKNAQDYRNNS